MTHRSRARNNIKNLPVRIKSTQENLTSQAGLIPVIKFLVGNLNFRKHFNEQVKHQRGNNAKYTLADIVMINLIGLVGGAFNLDKCVALWADPVLRQVSGIKDIPVSTTLSRLFKELKFKEISEFETFVHKLRQQIWQELDLLKITDWIDVDSTVKTCYGNQEGVGKGYNPYKKGALSVHPLLAFSPLTKEILQGWFRTGTAYTSNGITEFMCQLLAQFPEDKRIVLRADSGFFVGELLDYLDSKGHGYLIKVKIKNLPQVLDKQQWSPVSQMPDWEQAEFTYQLGSWSCSRSFIALRKIKEEQQAPQQLDFFENKKYNYFCYVTTESFTPWETHKCYGKRATSETWIEEAKGQMGLAHCKTNHFFANSALFQTAILAYNTVCWMGLISGNKTLQQWEPQTVRTFLVRVAGKLLTGGRQLVLKVPENHLHPKIWDSWIGFI